MLNMTKQLKKYQEKGYIWCYPSEDGHFLFLTVEEPYLDDCPIRYISFSGDSALVINFFDFRTLLPYDNYLISDLINIIEIKENKYV